MNESEMMNQIIQSKIMLKQLAMEHWAKYEVFSWQWWIGVAWTKNTRNNGIWVHGKYFG